MINRIKTWWRKSVVWCSDFWSNVRPTPEAHRGAVVGVLVAAAATVLVATYAIETGFGILFDFLFCLGFAAIFIPLTVGIVALLITILRALPRRNTGIILGSCFLVMLIWGPPSLGVPMAASIGLTEGILGAAIATLLFGNLAQAAKSKRVITYVLLVLALASNGFFAWLFLHSGSMEKIIAWKPQESSMPAKLLLANPSEKGPLAVKTLFYGQGTDIRRPEYGGSVAIKTRTVDATEFFKDFDGWKRWVRKTYWKFDVDKLPLNARVWYPGGDGPFPLALIVHGNHNMAEFSDPGYEYLGQLLASRGFILASIDENFLNSGLFHDPPKQQQVRGCCSNTSNSGANGIKLRAIRSTKKWISITSP